MHEEQSLDMKKSNNGNCAACTAQFPLVNTGQSISEAKYLITTDEEYPNIKYIGTKTPPQNHLYKAVRLACVRR
jgi:hypothetical protein